LLTALLVKPSYRPLHSKVMYTTRYVMYVKFALCVAIEISHFTAHFLLQYVLPNEKSFYHQQTTSHARDEHIYHNSMHKDIYTYIRTI